MPVEDGIPEKLERVAKVGLLPKPPGNSKGPGTGKEAGGACAGAIGFPPSITVGIEEAGGDVVDAGMLGDSLGPNDASTLL